MYAIGKTTGDKIREHRIKRNMTQAKLATLVGTSQAAITDIENNKRSPRFDTIIKISAALHTGILDLFPDYITEGAIIPSQYERELLEAVSDLNTAGRKKVREYAADLSKNPDYRV